MKAEFNCHYEIILKYLILYTAFVIVLISNMYLVIIIDENQYNAKTDTTQKIKS